MSTQAIRILAHMRSFVVPIFLTQSVSISQQTTFCCCSFHSIPYLLLLFQLDFAIMLLQATSSFELLICFHFDAAVFSIWFWLPSAQSDNNKIATIFKWKQHLMKYKKETMPACNCVIWLYMVNLIVLMRTLCKCLCSCYRALAYSLCEFSYEICRTSIKI